MRTKTIFISDIHIRGNGDAREQAFIRFLRQKASSMNRLVIGGDLFDFWIGNASSVYYPYLSVLYELLKLSRQGIDIDYVQGNHDFHLGDFFRKEIGCTIHDTEVAMTLDGRRVLVHHGDGINPKDHGYRLLRFVLRSRLMKFILKWIHPDLLWKIGHRSSKMSHYIRLKDGHVEKIYRSYAEKRLLSSDIDVLILGHNHVPDEKAFRSNGPNGTKKLYFNTGDWLTHFTYLEYGPENGIGKFSLNKFAFDTPVP